MSYVDGFVTPVPVGNRQAYLEMARSAAAVFLRYGATRVVECWGDDIPTGKTNDLRTAVLAEEGEAVLFSWIEWPDKATRDAGHEKAMADPEMKPPDVLPFSGPRLIYGGFTLLLDIREPL